LGWGDETPHPLGQRVASAYSMNMDGKTMSHALATTEFFPDSKGG
jgi:hypothetical protein